MAHNPKELSESTKQKLRRGLLGVVTLFLILFILFPQTFFDVTWAILMTVFGICSIAQVGQMIEDYGDDFEESGQKVSTAKAISPILYTFFTACALEGTFDLGSLGWGVAIFTAIMWWWHDHVLVRMQAQHAT